jgi:hypothetical protein
MLLVTVILWFIFPVMVSVYSFLIKSNKDVIARQTAIQQWYEFFERLNILMQDYTIDYEEYFNRQMVWCVAWWGTGDNFKWNIWTLWHCTIFSAYWNENSTQRNIVGSTINPKFHDIYRCSSSGDKNTIWYHRARNSDCWKFWVKQSFGQYKALFTDMRGVTLDDDDEELWHIVNNNDIRAIRDDKNIQELYLISHDGKKRLYFRRRLVNQNSGFAQYRVQILRLRWFDAWQKHSFNETGSNEWLYDWQIDTWACDSSMWFVWNWSGVWWAYSSYHLPINEEDCWVDLTYWMTNLYTWNISISPLWDPDLFRSVPDRQINPYMTIFILNWVYLPEFIGEKVVGKSIMDFKVPLKTTINMKDFYKE